ncbi:MAG: hypothetical protein V7711_06210 [Pseudomonadales bacterium]
MSDTETKVKLARVARGKRPAYLDDRAIDNLYAIVVTMMQENVVLRDRLDTLELLLERQGVVLQQQIETFVPDKEAADSREQRNRSYIEKLFRCLQDDRQQFDDKVQA